MRFNKIFLALSAAFALTATAFPVESDDKDNTEPTLSLGPHFVHYNNVSAAAEAHPARLQARFDKSFTPANNMQVLCDGATVGEGSNYRSKESDCKAAVNKLGTMNGYWECSGWTDGSNLRYFVLFEYGTCKAYAMASADKLIKIGNGDVFFWITEALKNKVTIEGQVMVRGQGTAPCNVGIKWSVSSG